MTPDFPPHNDFLKFSEELANQSRKMLLAVKDKAPEVDIKSDASFVTTTDKAVETALRAMIQEKYPTHGILGEEFENININADFVWVLDPIDGTAAFVAGIPVYGTLIGLAWRGRPYIGVIDHPVTADRWVGVSGRMAEHNGAPIQVRQRASLETAYASCSNSDFMTEEELARFTVLRKRAQYVQYGGSCYSYGVLASGRTDLAIDSGLDPFDVYACAAVIEGAGGFVTDWNGNPITFEMAGHVVAAGDKARLEDAIHILQE
jgi:inositol-phosphate phosphatase/L-galactose 1-phosphate phosphatase/histidinol-phosphatase|tara:strand:+ start:1132 stop:1917 length:786 start_codon:yes stop_codon:yes gene_type:complete